MTDPRLQAPSYRILRKGSRYNIFGPDGRVFSKYKSASVVGPRWEELTHTPWPYPSSAFESGSKLWELGLIERWEVGQRQNTLESPAEPPPVPRKVLSEPVHGTQLELLPQPKQKPRPKIQFVLPPLALPAPRIDLEAHIQFMQSLKRDPALLLDARARQALQYEIEYYRPDAKWASHLLRMLARYERRQNRQSTLDAKSILEKHIAWQEQQAKAAASV